MSSLAPRIICTTAEIKEEGRTHIKEEDGGTILYDTRSREPQCERSVVRQEVQGIQGLD